MLKKTIKFQDLDGNYVEEDFYFYLSPGALIELELGREGGLSDHLRKIIGVDEEGNQIGKPKGGEIIAAFKEILRNACGRRSPDGRRFEQNEEIWLSFLQSDAYSVLIMELCTDAEASAEFIKSIMPKKLADKMSDAKTLSVVPDSSSSNEIDTRPLYERENRRATPEEFKTMSPEEQRKAYAFQPYTP